MCGFRPIHFLALFLLSTTLGWAQWNVVTQQGRRYVPLGDVANFYRMSRPVGEGKGFSLIGPGKLLRGSIGGREVYLNNVKHVLCFEVESQNGQPLISAMDVTKIIEPVLRPGKIKNATAIRTVILDAGHGGHDGGARGALGNEKNFTLDVALRAKRLLEASGCKVRLTRSSDVFIPLEQRVAIANQYPNGIFVSIHFNKGSTGSGTGVETYCLAPRGVPSMDAESVSYNDLRQYPGHENDAENVALATACHSSMLRRLRVFDRGIKRARFVVIRDLKIPGVLLEGGFVDNPVDARLIASPDYRQRMALAVLDGVNAYRRAVNGQPAFTPPTVIASADGAGDQPPLDRPIAPETGINSPGPRLRINGVEINPESTQ
ncbi:MAG TPA: N-acetylmuramoyl-L-alanine amidase [Chthoniobacterales bacterium]